MKIGHIAIWTENLEELRDFYVKYFQGKSNSKYVNEKKGFESYFVEFDGGVSLEIMRRKDITRKTEGENLGICHFAFVVGTENDVLNMTEVFRKNNYPIVGEPRHTGDGFFESVILDPDGNRVELVAE